MVLMIKVAILYPTEKCVIALGLYFLMMLICMCVYLRVRPSSHIEVKGQLVGIGYISLSTTQVLGIDVRVADLVTSTFTP